MESGNYKVSQMDIPTNTQINSIYFLVCFLDSVQSVSTKNEEVRREYFNGVS